MRTKIVFWGIMAVVTFVLGLLPAISRADQPLGYVEYTCGNYNSSDDSVSGRIPISTAYGPCGLRSKTYHATATILAPSGWAYSIDLWFSRNRERRGLSSINLATIYKTLNSERAITSSMEGWSCNSLLVSDRQNFSLVSANYTNQGYTYPDSFACAIQIVPGKI